MAKQSPWQNELRNLLLLAAPLAAASAGNQLMGVVDTAIVGRLGAVELGAVGLANNLFMPLAVLGMGAMMGLDPLISQALGAGDGRRARHLLWQGIWISIGLGLLLSIPLVIAPSLLVPFGIEPAVARQAAIYLWVRLPSLFALLAFVTVRAYLQAVGITRPLLVSVIAANVVNAAADLLFVFGGSALPDWTGPLRAFPAMGVAGAALATVLCAFFQLAVVAHAIRFVEAPGFSPADRALHRAEALGSLRIGLPIGLQMFAEVGVFAFVGLLIGKIGSTELAAHQISLTLASFSFTLAVGVASAGSVRVGRAIGAGDTEGTRRAGVVAMAGGGALMSLWALTFMLFPGPLARLLTDEAAVVEAAMPLLFVAAIFQISDGLQAVAAGALRGAGDTRFPFLANVAGHYGVGLPVGFALGMGLGWGVSGLWWGLCTGLTAVAITLCLRFLRLSSRPIRPLAAAPAPTGAEA